jgi:selenocysteine lyase/cysteine desulfurase
MLWTSPDCERKPPLCRNVIHFNNASASPMPQPVYERLVTYLQREQEMGGYEAQAEHQQEIEDAYRRLADLIRARPSELALVGSASRAFQFGLSALLLEPGHKILTSRLEYVTVFMNLLRRREAGIEIEVVPEDGQGVIDLEIVSAGPPTRGPLRPGNPTPLRLWPWERPPPMPRTWAWKPSCSGCRIWLATCAKG